MNTLSNAARKPLFPRGPGLGLEYLLFVILSIGLMVADSRGERFRPIREWASVALRPLLWVTSLPHATVQLGQHLDSREHLLAENRELKNRQLELAGRLQRMAALEAENQRIRELLSAASSLQSRVLIAEVLAVSGNAYRHQVLLGKGERDGVYRGQAVVDADGIMGQVIAVNPTTAIALLITDPEHGIPVQVTRTGLQTVALGRGDGQTLSLPYLPGNADVKVGDLLTSSGLGGRFPPGYPVGKVTQLRHPAGENFMEAIAMPAAQLGRGGQALLVWNDQPGATLDASAVAALMAPPPADAARRKPLPGKRVPPAAPERRP
ncbi:MAG: rod shape-determining protein MreC [Nevskia sp.]|nr:rod shape-determining protein MreC [Nevskia sp.]